MSDNKELGNNLKSSTKWLSNASTRNIQNSTKTSSNTTLNYKMDIKKDETLNGTYIAFPPQKKQLTPQETRSTVK